MIYAVYLYASVHDEPEHSADDIAQNERRTAKSVSGGLQSVDLGFCNLLFIITKKNVNNCVIVFSQSELKGDYFSCRELSNLILMALFSNFS